MMRTRLPFTWHPCLGTWSELQLGSALLHVQKWQYFNIYASLILCIRVVRLLVHKYPPALTDEDENGNTPLHLAAFHGKTEVVDFLIHEGAEVDAK